MTRLGDIHADVNLPAAVRNEFLTELRHATEALPSAPQKLFTMLKDLAHAKPDRYLRKGPRIPDAEYARDTLGGLKRAMSLRACAMIVTQDFYAVARETPPGKAAKLPELQTKLDWTQGKVISSILEDVLKRRPDDARALAIVRDEVRKPRPTSGALELAAEYESAWFNATLPSLGVVPDGHQIVMWLITTKDRRGLMDALVASGPAFIETLDRRLHDPRVPGTTREQFREAFALHPAFVALLR